MQASKQEEKINKFLGTLTSKEVPVEVVRGEDIWKGFFKSHLGNILRVQFFERLPSTKLKKSEFLQIQFVYEGSRRQFVTRPTQYLPDKNIILLEIPYLLENLDVRRFPRFELNFPVRIYLKLDDRLIHGYLSNVSEGGALLSIDQSLTQKDAYLFAAAVPAENGFSFLFFKAEVAHVSKETEGNTCYVGIRFIEVESSFRKKIKNFVLALSIWKSLGDKSPEDVKSIVMPDTVMLQREDGALLKEFSKYISLRKKLKQKKLDDKRHSDKLLLCVVETSEEVRNLKRDLSDYYRLEFLVNPLGTVAKMLEIKPDLVISDIDISTVDFFTIRRAAERVPEITDIFFVIYTSVNDKTTIVNALKFGNIKEYIIRPIIKESFVSRLNTVLDNI